MSGCPGRPRRRPQPGVRAVGADARRRAALELAVRAAAGTVLAGAGRLGARGRAGGRDLSRAARRRLRLQPRQLPADRRGRRPQRRRQLRPQPLLVAGHRPAAGARRGRRPRRLQPRQGHAAAPRPDRRDGVFDFRFPVDPETAPWHFAAVGSGRGVDEWSHLLAALRTGRLRRRRLDRARGSARRRRAGHPRVARWRCAPRWPGCRRERDDARRRPRARESPWPPSATCCTTPRPSRRPHASACWRRSSSSATGRTRLRGRSSARTTHDAGRVHP